MLHKYEVGTLYHPTRTSWPEGSNYNYRQGAHVLELFINRPRSEEVAAVRRGPAEFALVVSQPVILLLYRFLPGLPWGDAPFTIHIVPPEWRTVPELPEPFLERYLLTVHLVDAGSGILKAMRITTLSPPFTAELHAAIRAQHEAPFDQRSYDAHLAGLYRRYPRADDMLRDAVIRCDGGRYEGDES